MALFVVVVAFALVVFAVQFYNYSVKHAKRTEKPAGSPVASDQPLLDQ